MRLTEQYVEKLKAGDFMGLAELFDSNGSINDVSPKDMDEPLIAYGKEAIEMLYHNKMFFGTFKILEVLEITDTYVTFVAAYDGERYAVRAMVQPTDDGEKIRKVVSRVM